MRLSFDDGTLFLENAPDTVPYADWDDRVLWFKSGIHVYAVVELAEDYAVSPSQ